MPTLRTCKPSPTSNLLVAHDSPFWGIRQESSKRFFVNARDKVYQRAYRAFLVRLVQARREAGLTQVEVSARMGRARTFLSKCELGERRVDFVELQQLARIYGKGLDFFITLVTG